MPTIFEHLQRRRAVLFSSRANEACAAIGSSSAPVEMLTTVTEYSSEHLAILKAIQENSSSIKIHNRSSSLRELAAYAMQLRNNQLPPHLTFIRMKDSTGNYAVFLASAQPHAVVDSNNVPIDVGVRCRVSSDSVGLIMDIAQQNKQLGALLLTGNVVGRTAANWHAGALQRGCHDSQFSSEHTGIGILAETHATPILASIVAAANRENPMIGAELFQSMQQITNQVAPTVREVVHVHGKSDTAAQEHVAAIGSTGMYDVSDSSQMDITVRGLTNNPDVALFTVELSTTFVMDGSGALAVATLTALATELEPETIARIPAVITPENLSSPLRDALRSVV